LEGLLVGGVAIEPRSCASGSCLERSGAPVTVGGDGVARGSAPDPARYPAPRNLEPGFFKGDARFTNANRAIPYLLSREHRLACPGYRQCQLAEEWVLA